MRKYISKHPLDGSIVNARWLVNEAENQLAFALSMLKAAQSLLKSAHKKLDVVIQSR